MKKTDNENIDRRRFLKGAVASAGVVALSAPSDEVKAQAAQDVSVAPPSATAMAAETQPVSLDVEVLTTDRPGADFMVDIMKSLNFEYVAANPGSSFRGLHEALVNYGGNSMPELLTCCHEESSVGLADGYARIEGRPMAVLAHGTVGLQHASMTIYNAFSAAVPVFIILGNSIDAMERRPGVEWYHSVQDAAAMVRDYIKWDDLPISLNHFAESSVRAYKIATTPPHGPVIIVADGGLQEEGVEQGAALRIPKLTLASPPAGDPGAVEELAKLLVAAEYPLLIGGADAIRSEQSLRTLIELAELLQAPVDYEKFPSQHPLSGGRVGEADVIVGLSVSDLWGTVHNYRDQQTRSYSATTRPGAKLISINAGDLYLKSNYQGFQRYAEVDMAIAADADATLPWLLEACKKLVTANRQRAFAERGKMLAAAHRQSMEQARLNATYAWDASPISTARMSAELWDVVKDKDWANVGGRGSRLWNNEKYYQVMNGGGAAALGASLPISIGAALAHRKHGRFCFSIQTDGDLMYAPGALWTAAHHQIPLLMVMHNNRAYHQEVMHIQRMALRHQRGISGTADIGCTLKDPNIDFATMAKSLGVHGEGPITDPKDLRAALLRAADAVENGMPALVDVVTQPR
jgi:thiamine pyrophosphate-dependent acetolactate synthase large subunit-like protein